jgi:1,2-dihydroxy-3-keto-5-methylthiopentene dioxygenase
MSILTIHPDRNPEVLEVVHHAETIAEKLWEIEVLFERWTADQEFPPEADQDCIISAYRRSIDHLIDRYEFHSIDVISVSSDHPQKKELRDKFLSEHTHDDFEVRFFVEGRGIFYMHSHGKVYTVLCEQGDLISIPAQTKHWFDMGERPNFKAIRLFTTQEGWIAQYTGDKIAEAYPRFEAFMTQYA